MGEVIQVGDKVLVDKKEYEELQEEAKFMHYLRAAGVDNWEGWDYAIEMMEAE